MSEAEPDDTSDYDDYQGSEDVLDFGGGLDIPAVNKCQKT
jgi:hypothetical protein